MLFPFSLELFPFPFIVCLSANNIITFEIRLDKHWQRQEMIYDCRAQIHGTGSRSEVSSVNVA